MAVYVVAQGRITDRKVLDEYVDKAISTLDAHGALVVAFDENPQVIEGTTETPRTVILEFSSHEAFRAWYDSPEYQAILLLRLSAAPGTIIVANGFAPPAAE